MDKSELLGILSRYGEVTTVTHVPVAVWHVDLAAEDAVGVVVVHFRGISPVPQIEGSLSLRHGKCGLVDHKGGVGGTLSGLAGQKHDDRNRSDGATIVCDNAEGQVSEIVVRGDAIGDEPAQRVDEQMNGLHAVIDGNRETAKHPRYRMLVDRACKCCVDFFRKLFWHDDA